jgi:hypothetical protein
MAVIEAISTTYLEADAASVTFSSIPATYEHLQLRCNMKSNRTNSSDDVRIYLGDSSDSPVDTGSGYYSHYLSGSTTIKGSGVNSSAALRLMRVAGSKTDEDAANYGSMVIDISDYANANKNITVLGIGGLVGDSSSTGALVALSSGIWETASVVTAVRVEAMDGSGWIRGSEFTLYGLKSS